MSDSNSASNHEPAGENNDTASVPQEKPPREIIVRHRQVGKTFAWQILAVTGWISVLVLFLFLQYHYFIAAEFYDDAHGIRQVYHSGNKNAKNKIAIIKITGVIYDGSGYVKRQIDRVLEDPDIKAIVLRVNSPGGTVSGSDYIYHHLQKLLESKKIPLVVSMGSVAASGGYYVSMVVGDQEDSIFAEPTCTTGSIGVIIPHWNYSELMETYGVVDDSIMSHPRKRMLTPSKRMPEDHKQLLQAYVDESFYEFKKKVLAGRPKFRPGNETSAAGDGSDISIAHEGRDVATGEIFHAPTALRYGLVDRLGFIEDAIERAAELAELNMKNTKIVEYSRPAPWLEIPFLSQAQASNQILDTLMELNSSRAYYLSSNLPPLLTSWEDPYRKSAE